MMFQKYDYTHTLMMKLDLSIPDHSGGTKILCTLEEALAIIKQVDRMTFGYTKVLYLVGWQYNGHDDRYPEFFEVNPKLKRPQDAIALDSLLWLVRESKKYHTVISYHINISDAYAESQLWSEYIAKDLIVCGRSGKPKVTGIWNGRKAYQVRLAQEWESGYFQKRVDRLLELLPIEETGTIHIDAFFVHRGKHTAVASEKAARRKMIEYFNSRGIEVTSEFLYRERNSGLRLHFGKSDTIGLIAAFWKPVFSPRDILKYPASLVGFGELCKSLTPYKQLEWLIYGNLHGEDLFRQYRTDPQWAQKFLTRFLTYTVPHYYLNQFRRLKMQGVGRARRLYHSQGVVSYVAEHRIEQNGKILKQGNELCLPEVVRENSYLAYSQAGGMQTWYMQGRVAQVYRLTTNGVSATFDTLPVVNGKLRYVAQPHSAYRIEVKA